MTHFTLLLRATILLFAVLSNGAQAQRPQYIVKVVDSALEARDMNAAGLVVGRISLGVVAGTYDRTLPPARSVAVIGFLPGDTTSDAYAINKNKVIVGQSSSGLSTRAFIFTAPAGLSFLGALASGDSSATAINDAGTAAGWSVDGQNNRRAVIFNPPLAPTDLGTLGGDLSTANGIDEDNAVVGQAETPIATQAFLAPAVGAMQNLGTLGGTNSEAKAIRGGTVVGWSHNAANQTRAFIKVAGQGMQEIGLPLAGHMESIAYSVNQKQQIVGHSFRSRPFQSLAFIRHPGGGLEDLNRRVPVGTPLLTKAIKITDREEILAVSDPPGGGATSYHILTPNRKPGAQVRFRNTLRSGQTTLSWQANGEEVAATINLPRSYEHCDIAAAVQAAFKDLELDDWRVLNEPDGLDECALRADYFNAKDEIWDNITAIEVSDNTGQRIDFYVWDIRGEQDRSPGVQFDLTLEGDYAAGNSGVTFHLQGGEEGVATTTASIDPGQTVEEIVDTLVRHFYIDKTTDATLERLGPNALRITAGEGDWRDRRLDWRGVVQLSDVNLTLRTRFEVIPVK